MAEEKKNTGRFHNIILENRNQLSASGIEDVDSFDESSISMFTELGVLTVRGEDLHINKFSIETGELSIEGNIFGLAYSDDSGKKSGGGFFAKVFR